MKHPKLFELLRPCQETAKHLDECKTCALKAIALAEFSHNALALEIIEDKKSNYCLSNDDIFYIVNGTTVNEKGMEHIKSCGHCFKETAYYQAKSTEMKNAELPKTPDHFLNRAIANHPVKTGRKVEKLSWSRLISHIFKQPVPAFAVLLLFAFLVFAENPSPHIKILSGGGSFKLYAPTPSDKPLYYFGKTGKQIGEKPASIKADAGLLNIKFQWSRVGTSKTNYFIIHDITGVAPKMVVQTESQGNIIKISLDRFKTRHKYKVLVAGSMKEKGYFTGELIFKLTD